MDRGQVNLLDILQKAVSDKIGEQYSKICKVDKYDENAGTVDVSPLDETAPILGVRIVAGQSDSGLLVVPVVGSFVAVTFISETSAIVSMFSEIETVSIRGDQYGGLIKIEELKKQLEIVTSRLNTLYDAIKNATTAAQDGGATLQSTMKVILSTQIETENFDSIENESVKHG
tara:strand:+ start:1577 stop:2095 length:519 start_codon:yes stop_codon:yes gene_type:complete